jgi:hypothetical protein
MGGIGLGEWRLNFAHRGRFRLFSFENLFDAESYALLQGAFREVKWEKKETYFYTQFRSLIRPSDPHALAHLLSPAFFFPFKERLEAAIGVSLQNYAQLMAHRLVTSDEIGVHNDYAAPEFGHENFRVIFQFAEPGELLSGGELIFLASRDREDPLRQYAYASNMAICFEITPHSFHCVTPVEGERHTLVMYLWEEGRLVQGGSPTWIDQYAREP